MRHRALWVFLVVLSIQGAIHGQNAGQSHHHPQSAVIDGAVNPELIPDLTAYRLWLLAVSRSPNPTDIEVKHQAAQLAKVGFRDADRRTAIGILTTFWVQYQDVVKAYNETAKVAWAKGGRSYPDGPQCNF